MQTVDDVIQYLAVAVEKYRRSSKFEGGSDATLYYYQSTMDGDGKYRGIENEHYEVLDITATEAKVLQLPKSKKFFIIHETDDGFVYGNALNKTEYKKFDRSVSKIEEKYSDEY